MIDENLKKIIIENNENFTDILGQDNVKYQLKSSLISDRHLIVIGQPGIGKTTLAKNLSRILPKLTVNNCGFNCIPDQPHCPKCKDGNQETKDVLGTDRFIRIQGSPDLTVEDLMGDIDPVKALKFGPLSIEAFSPGKIFKANNGILFFDEINRCPEKLQNALLQVLEEGFATIGSYEIDIPTNFILIATMNPKDINTERLSDVLLDRFDMIEMTYPETKEIEKEIVKQKGKKMEVKFPENLIQFLVDFIRDLRANTNLEVVPSVRATLGLYERAQANTIIDKRDTVHFNDIRNAMNSVISHRIKLKPSSKYLTNPDELINNELEKFLETNQLYKEFKADVTTEGESSDAP